MRNPFTEAEEYEYQDAMRQRREEEERQLRQDAMDAFPEEDNDD